MQKKVALKERPLNKKSLDSSDVFILDLGLEIYQVSLQNVLSCCHRVTVNAKQWNGKTCNKDEKFKAVQYLQTLKVLQSTVSGHSVTNCCLFSQSEVGSLKWRALVCNLRCNVYQHLILMADR